MNRTPRIFGVMNYKNDLYWFAEIKGARGWKAGLNNYEHDLLVKAQDFAAKLNSKNRGDKA